MAELLDNGGLLDDKVKKQQNKRYKLLMWLFVFINPLFFGWTHYLFGSLKTGFLLGTILLMFYPIGLFFGMALFYFSIRFSFDIAIAISKSMGKNDWWDWLFATKTKVNTYIDQN